MFFRTGCQFEVPGGTYPPKKYPSAPPPGGFPQDIKSCISLTKLPLLNKNNKGKNCCILVILSLERSKITHNLLEASAVGPRVLLDRTHRPGIQYHKRPPAILKRADALQPLPWWCLVFQVPLRPENNQSKNYGGLVDNVLKFKNREVTCKRNII